MRPLRSVVETRLSASGHGHPCSRIGRPLRGYPASQADAGSRRRPCHVRGSFGPGCGKLKRSGWRKVTFALSQGKFAHLRALVSRLGPFLGHDHPGLRDAISYIEVKTPEQEAALRAIRKLIDFWQIEPEELVGGEVPVKFVPVELPPKYRHPVSGDTWDGQGSQPQWLREALTKQGYTVEELRHTPPAAAEGLSN